MTLSISLIEKNLATETEGGRKGEKGRGTEGMRMNIHAHAFSTFMEPNCYSEFIVTSIIIGL